MKKLVLLIAIVAGFQISLMAKIKPVNLTCEFTENPSVVDVLKPRLGWINIADEGERGQIQTAWQIRVASSREILDKPDLWDSGKKKGNESDRISYGGKSLKSRQDCWWQV